jgi:cell wall-associated NlpC family hydrolase
MLRCTALINLFLLGACLTPPQKPAPARAPQTPVENPRLPDSGPEKKPEPRPEKTPDAPTPLKRLRHTVQVGAFAVVDNAVRLAETLQARHLDAFYFKDADGLYKVRFGDYAERTEARETADSVVAAGLVESAFIVTPESFAAARGGDVRGEIIRTAERFIGVPYKWGGTTENGFDCSGLTMVVYRLNGLELPRVADAQKRAGKPLSRAELAPGDLVFFATAGGNAITHVGIFAGGDRFLHAPSRGKLVRYDSLDSAYFKRTFRGGATYL